MAVPSILRRVFVRSQPFTATYGGTRTLISGVCEWRSHYGTSSAAAEDYETEGQNEKKKGEWFTLPPFTSTIDGDALGKDLSGRRSTTKSETTTGGGTTSTTALKWVLRSCPKLPRSLAQKLFRLRQV
ncbi:unnamed protein product [Ilex paraguariensis]|uniref:Uncharacterized protein n=1 Tax=Ilex paraguariensis TaxID=185542 RepID=A0ABC8TNI8_9AQUA